MIDQWPKPSKGEVITNLTLLPSFAILTLVIGWKLSSGFHDPAIFVLAVLFTVGVIGLNILAFFRYKE